MMKHKRDVFKFSGKKHSVLGIGSLIVGSISVIAFLVLTFISSLSAGHGGLLLGVIGMVLFGITIAGFIMGIKCYQEKDIYYTAPIIGLVLNGFLFLVYFILYLIGFII